MPSLAHEGNSTRAQSGLRKRRRSSRSPLPPRARALRCEPRATAPRVKATPLGPPIVARPLRSGFFFFLPGHASPESSGVLSSSQGRESGCSLSPPRKRDRPHGAKGDPNKTICGGRCSRISSGPWATAPRRNLLSSSRRPSPARPMVAKVWKTAFRSIPPPAKRRPRTEQQGTSSRRRNVPVVWISRACLDHGPCRWQRSPVSYIPRTVLLFYQGAGPLHP